MDESGGFYTIKGYSLREDSQITNAMEDYLEMIARLSRDHGRVRVNELAQMLHVKASSASKMIQQLAQQGYLHAEKYGELLLTEDGRQLGEYLLYRHDVLQRFLCFVNGSRDELKQVERIEHFLDKRTIYNLELLLQKIKPDSN